MSSPLPDSLAATVEGDITDTEADPIDYASLTPIRQIRRPAEAKALFAIAAAAESWWRGKRPLKWGPKDHMASPTVNTVGPRERHLAEAVAAWKQIESGS